MNPKYRINSFSGSVKYAFTMVSHAAWITTAIGIEGISNKVELILEKNTTGVMREGLVTLTQAITGQEINITVRQLA
jgi:hypothetical protein